MSWATIGAFALRLIEAAARAVPFALAFLAGRARARQGQAERDRRIKDEQLRRAADRPRDRADLVRRLRRDGL